MMISKEVVKTNSEVLSYHLDGEWKNSDRIAGLKTTRGKPVYALDHVAWCDMFITEDCHVSE
jgi:hypothetical protein